MKSQLRICSGIKAGKHYEPGIAQQVCDYTDTNCRSYPNNKWWDNCKSGTAMAGQKCNDKLYVAGQGVYQNNYCIAC